MDQPNHHGSQLPSYFDFQKRQTQSPTDSESSMKNINPIGAAAWFLNDYKAPMITPCASPASDFNRSRTPQPLIPSMMHHQRHESAESVLQNRNIIYMGGRSESFLPPRSESAESFLSSKGLFRPTSENSFVNSVLEMPIPNHQNMYHNQNLLQKQTMANVGYYEPDLIYERQRMYSQESRPAQNMYFGNQACQVYDQQQYDQHQSQQQQYQEVQNSFQVKDEPRPNSPTYSIGASMIEMAKSHDDQFQDSSKVGQFMHSQQQQY